MGFERMHGVGRRAALPLALALLASTAAAEVLAGTCAGWPAWTGFRDTFVSGDGRVIDRSTPRQHTVSEAQAYALVFALAADERGDFERILAWTTDNLARGDLTQHLPAWQWGRRDDGSWGTLDANSATDADLWLAWALAEAGRHWNAPRYLDLSHAIAAHVLRDSVADVPRLGPVLLPAPEGFRDADGGVRLNPAYLPLQVLRGLAAAHADQRERWHTLADSAIAVLHRSAPRGVAPDWVRVDRNGRLGFPTPADAVGSYDAIRVYLWLGLLSPAEPARAALLRRFRPMARLVRRHGGPPERVDARTGRAWHGAAPGAFSAAVAPWLSGIEPGLARRQWQRASEREPARDEYYARALVLFAEGWREGWLRFGPDGELLQAEDRCVANAS